MREIKFRAWDKEEKIMGEVLGIDILHKEIFFSNEDEKYIQEIVNLLNEEYGIPKRWRSEEKCSYWYIDSDNAINLTDENFYEEDDDRYNLGNYFQTREQAQKVIDSKEWQDFWAKVRAGEIGGDE